MKTFKKQEAEILRAAADLIDEKGWIAGIPVSSGGFCALGAIALVVNYDQNPLSADRYVPRFAKHISKTFGTKVWTWNDHLYYSTSFSYYLHYRSTNRRVVSPVAAEMRKFADSLNSRPEPKVKKIKRIKDLAIAALIK